MRGVDAEVPREVRRDLARRLLGGDADPVGADLLELPVPLLDPAQAAAVGLGDDAEVLRRAGAVLGHVDEGAEAPGPEVLGQARLRRRRHELRREALHVLAPERHDVRPVRLDDPATRVDRRRQQVLLPLLDLLELLHEHVVAAAHLVELLLPLDAALHGARRLPHHGREHALHELLREPHLELALLHDALPHVLEDVRERVRHHAERLQLVVPVLLRDLVEDLSDHLVVRLEGRNAGEVLARVARLHAGRLHHDHLHELHERRRRDDAHALHGAAVQAVHEYG
mmetsp:Transcript_2910/g.8404  ORF Transcript_2910/g.8404 Transcript_2910/m.8404 type:complete len:284 (+) Transcript_2910:580-1431(+)